MKNIVYYIAIATVLLFASCASELDTEPSGSQVSDEQLSELIKENADLVLAPMMQGAVNYMHTGNRQATTNDRGFMVWNLGMDLQGNDMVLTKASVPRPMPIRQTAGTVTTRSSISRTRSST